MLKKNPNVVDTIKKLRRYVGNTKNWKLSDDDKRNFNENAEKVRQKAEEIYNSFKVNVWLSQLTYRFFF